MVDGMMQSVSWCAACRWQAGEWSVLPLWAGVFVFATGQVSMRLADRRRTRLWGGSCESQEAEREE